MIGKEEVTKEQLDTIRDKLYALICSVKKHIKEHGKIELEDGIREADVPKEYKFIVDGVNDLIGYVKSVNNISIESIALVANLAEEVIDEYRDMEGDDKELRQEVGNVIDKFLFLSTGTYALNDDQVKAVRMIPAVSFKIMDDLASFIVDGVGSVDEDEALKKMGEDHAKVFAHLIMYNMMQGLDMDEFENIVKGCVSVFLGLCTIENEKIKMQVVRSFIRFAKSAIYAVGQTGGPQ